MSGVKKYFNKEFKTDMLFLENDDTFDFYLACWQGNRSPVPLLLLRTIIFVGCVCIVITSMTLTVVEFGIGTWFIYLTHWGLLFNTVASGFAMFISVKAFKQKSDDERSKLLWYMKVYWAFYNIAVPIAFFITFFYWILLSEVDGEYAISLVLDVFIHGVNSVLMLALVIVSRHPTHLLHCYWSVSVALFYMVFTVIFHFSGAISPFCTSWIYPMIDWNDTGTTLGVAFGSAVVLIAMHVIVVVISLVRDKLTRRYRETNSIHISAEGYC